MRLHLLEARREWLNMDQIAHAALVEPTSGLEETRDAKHLAVTFTGGATMRVVEPDLGPLLARLQDECRPSSPAKK